MFARNVKTTFESNSGELHEEHETRNTRVSEYLRKYGQGKIDTMPTDTRPQVVDNRPTDEKLDNSDITDYLGTDQIDVMCEVERKREDFKAAFAEIELTQKQKEKFDAAIKVLEDKNSSYDQVQDAYRILEQLEQDKKVTRARY